MKFTANSVILLKHLNIINGAVPSSPLIPILENFLFEVTEDTLVVTASDLNTTMTTQLAVDSEGSATICVPAKLIVETLKSLPDQPVSFLLDLDTFAVTLISENGKYKVSGENAIDFPKIPAVKSSDEILIPASVLSKAVNNTLFAVGNDDLRPAMTGVLFEFSENNTTYVATDGHRLVRYKRFDIVSENEASMIVPKKALNLLKAALPNDSQEVTMTYTAQNAYFKFENNSLICRLVEERYPDYQAAIPTANPFTMTIHRVDFLNSLKRVSLYANKSTHQVRLKISETDLMISGEDVDFSNEGNESLPCEYDGDPMEIGFNARLLTEMLSNMDSNLVELQLAAPNKQGILLPKIKDDNEDILMLVMPVMLTQYTV